MSIKLSVNQKMYITIVILIATFLFTFLGWKLINERSDKIGREKIYNLKKSECITIDSSRLPSDLNKEYTIEPVSFLTVRVCKK